MKRLMVLTFGLLGWAWYSMSGGAEFSAGTNGVDLPVMVRAAEAETLPADPSDTAVEPEVTRASTASLTDVGPAESQATVTEAKVTGAAATAKSMDLALAAVPDKPIAASFEPESAEPETPADLRKVTGSRVNLRYGPGTSYSVVGQLGEGDRVEVLSDPGDGWVKLQAQDGGTAGWMYDAYLAAAVN